MTDAAHKTDFDRDGFVVARQSLDGEELAELRRELDRYITEVPALSDAHAFYHDRNDPGTLKTLQHMGRDAFFDAYRWNPRWGKHRTQGALPAVATLGFVVQRLRRWPMLFRISTFGFRVSTTEVAL